MAKLKKWAFYMCFIGLTIISMMYIHPTEAKAAIEPGHEIKLNIKSDIFTESNIANVFQATKKDDVKIYFYDTSDKMFLQNDYIHRLRVYKGSNKMDITYKKRFLHTPLNEAIAEATDQGFTGSESNYKFELDIKGDQRTFTISRKESLKTTSNVSYDSVDTPAAKKLILDYSPKKILNWDAEAWYKNVLSQAVVYGPAKATTYKGSFLGHDADIEVWAYKGDIMVELSTKVDDSALAAVIEQQWYDQLLSAGYLSEDQRGKTTFVMDK
ncbi:hypothetical protein MPH48_03895 [Lysinibacillus fusiformis]|uniref:hypothetical protein n=1 Tax=Lysinibacillus fusiformis TaxID=28031 RepID=UPI001F4E79A7|nr:hypothetical protein [Lysinibacillus fusiformis]MCK1987243.1 hypothetical protein [Lysinibacillus fusiformis]